MLGDCYGVGIVQRYSRKQLGTPPPPITSAQTDTTYSPSKEEDSGAGSPAYGSSSGVAYVSTGDPSKNVSPSALHDSEDTSTNKNALSLKLDGGPDSAVTSDRDETKL